MAAELTIPELERAASVVLAPPNAVTGPQRHQAEEVFLRFRKSKLPYAFCRQILETSKNDYVLFQVATTIKEAVVREWNLLDPSDVEGLRNFLLHFVTHNIHLQNYVREQILQAVAIIFKRGTVDKKHTSRDALFSDVTQLISSGNLSMQLVACSILTALLNEYSTTSRSSSVGMTWEFHIQCKRAFEESDLKKVFTFCLQVLHELEKAPTPMDRELTAVFNRFLSITEQVLNWAFIPKNLPRKLIGSFLGETQVSFKPPESWRDLVLDKDFLNMMFRIHRKIRYNSEMAHHSLQCLAQLASLNGSVLKDDNVQTEYLGNYVITFIDLVTNLSLQDYEALGISNIINNLLMFFTVSHLTALPQESINAFIHSFTKLTCHFGQAAALEEALLKDDTVFMEAYEKLLDSWMLLVGEGMDVTEFSLQQPAGEIFNSYLQCHLSVPDGTRNQAGSGGVSDDEYDELDEDDRTKFKDQLCCIGAFGRLVAPHSIPLLIRLLEDRLSRLHSHLHQLQQQQVMSPGNTSNADATVLNNINEDLHWLLLVTGSVLSDEALGETPMIPAEIMQYSVSQSDKSSIDVTLKVLTSPSTDVNSVAGAEATDPVVRLVSSVFRLCEVQHWACQSNLTYYLSPQVCQSSMWVLRRWLMAYLLPNEDYYSQISLAISSAFGRDTKGGEWTIGFLLEKVLTNIRAWSSEPALLEDTLEVLVALVEKKDRAEYVIQCDSLWKIASDQAANQQEFDVLPGPAKRQLYQALVLAGSAKFEKRPKEEYWKLVLESLYDRFRNVTGRPNFKDIYQQEPVKHEILSLLESLCGVVEASRLDNVDLLFRFIHPAMVHSIDLLDIYHSYEDVVQLVLELFNMCSNQQICFLSQSDSKQFYECTINMMQVYAKHNIGKKTCVLDLEEDHCKDLVMLLELLTSILSKDFVDFGANDCSGDSNNITPPDVCLFGLNIIVPLMNPELLKFPALCTAYFRLITYVAEVYTDKVCHLPEPLQKQLYASIDLGLSVYGPDTCQLCLEFLTWTSSHLCQSPVEQLYIHQALQHFLKVLFKMLLIESFNMDLIDTASSAFFCLICLHQGLYKQLVNDILSQQTDPALHQRLLEAFSQLTPPSLVLKPERQAKIQFMSSFEKFIVNVRGFLCVR